MARYAQTGRNFSFFDAPVGLIFTVDERLKKHSWLDIGLFVQNVMIAAKARGLDTCPQVLFARYPGVIAEYLKLQSGQDVVCGMSLGLADELASVNRLDMPREPVERFATFLGFPD
jgi:nitroreductase